MDEIREYSLRLGTAALGVGHADGFSALGAGTGLALGLLARKRGGPGQSMLTTMLNTVAHAISEDMIEYDGRAAAPAPDAGLHGLSALYRLYETADDWVFLAAPQPREWEALTNALAPYGDLATDARFATEDARTQNDATLAEALGAILRTRAGDDWERDLTAVDVACVVVAQGPPESVIMEGDDSLGHTMDIVVEMEHPAIGDYLRLTPLAGMSRSRGVTGGAPLVGQHTNAVLAEIGYSPDQIEDLRSRGIVGG